jgi:N6-L-threonylcarbamoyladenine synthase
MLASREHAQNIGHVFDQAIQEAGIEEPTEEIDLIAVTRGPGLGPALLVGITFARALAMQWDKPIIGTNHMEGHIYSNWLPVKPSQDVRFPILNVIVSGGHTELVLMRGHGQYEIIGETLDDAAGEAFDKIARLLGLGYPGGPEISRLAAQGDPHRFELPRPMLKSKSYEFSYSGLKTAVLYLVRDLEKEGGPLTDRQKADVAASFQEAAIDVLVQKAARAAKEHDVSAIFLSGGVSANRALRDRLRAASIDLEIGYAQPELKWTGDNAAMIAVAGFFQYQNGSPTSPSGTVAVPQGLSDAPQTHPKEKTDSSWESVAMDANLRLG